MGLSLRNIGKKISDLAHGAEHSVGQVVHNATHNPVTNVIGNVEQAAVHTVARAPQYINNPVNQIRGVGQVLGATTPHIPTFSNSSPLRFANNAFINPTKTTGFHVSQLAQGNNPYSGSVKQQIGQAGQDALTLAAAVPIGRGAELAAKSAPLAAKVVTGVKGGAKIGAGFGAAQGLSTAAQNNLNLKNTLKTTALSTAAGTGFGVAGGAAAPLIGAGAKLTIKAADNRVPLNETGSLGNNIPHMKTQENFAKLDKTTHPGKNVEMVPTAELAKYSEFNRGASPLMSSTKYAALKEDVAKNGIKEPLQLMYGAKDRIASLGEGNHRLAVAKELGIKELPVEVTGTQLSKAAQIADKKGFAAVPGREPDQFGYVPSNQKPSDIGVKTAQPTQVAKPTVTAKTPAPVKLSPLEEQLGHSIKTTPYTGPNLNKGAFSEADQAALAKAESQQHPLEVANPALKADELANLSPDEQMKRLSPSHTPLAAAEENTAKNPFKATIPEVKHNDFGQVIANEQVAGEIGRDNVLRSLAQLRRVSPAEYKNFWEYANADPGFKDAPKSAELQRALEAWRTADNRIHGNSQGLGGNTNYLQDHGLHPVVFNEDMTNQLLSGTDPNKFSGLHNLTRKHPTMASLRAAAEQGGFTVGTDPLSEADHYLSASAHALRRRAIIKGVSEADAANLEKPHTLMLGSGDKNRVDISQKAHDELRGLQRSLPTTNRVAKGLRTANVGTKSLLLSFGQFHPNNISLMRAAPTLAAPKPSMLVYRNRTTGKLGVDPTMGSHPVRAVKGLYATYRPLVPGSGTNFAAKVNAKAVADGMDLKAARIGAPYNAQLYDSSGSSISGIGHKLLGRQMLGMHDQAVRAVVSDLEKRGIPLDSAEARTAGKAANNMMGFINNEAQKIPPVVSRQLGDWLLARQFTHSKFSQLRTGATNMGVGGAYARANVAANVAASTAVIAGVGYLLQQKSDNIRDALIRAITDPAIPTPMKDSKGNTVKLRIPGTDASDVAKLLGIKPVRQADGHLGISWNPGNMPSTVTDYFRARLAPIPGVGLKVATNENYAGKPLYDPQAKFGTKVEQGATTALGGLLPIGAQGLPMVNSIEKHLPGNVQDVLNANKPGGDPLVKSLGSSFGVTPTTDATTGKGLENSRYFAAVDKAVSHAKNVSEKTALENYFGSKKNPVTGKYNVNPNANDSGRKAKDLLDAPGAIDIVKNANQELQKQGGKIDPLWNLPKDQIVKVLQYQTYPYAGPDKTHWYNANKDWYTPLSDARSQFFSSLPKGDPNKPQQPIEFPSPSKEVAAKQDTFFKLTDSAQRAKYLQENPDVQQQLDKQVEYGNNIRVATLGKGSELDTFPKADPGVQKIISAYNALPKKDGPKGGNKTRSLWIKSHPKEYAAMTKYFTQASLYGLEKDASQAEFKDTGMSSTGLKDVVNLAKDIGTQTDANGNKFYVLGGDNAGGGSGGSSYSRGGYSSKPKVRLPNEFALSLDAGGKVSSPKAKVGKATTYKAKKVSSAKPKVTIKKALV